MKLLFLTFFIVEFLWAQIPAQLNLEDVQIKGEGSSKNLLSVSSRKKNNLNERISLKDSLIEDILESLPDGFEPNK